MMTPRHESNLPETLQPPESFYEWDESKAQSLAADEQIPLTEAHWEVIRFLRRHCAEHGTAGSARHLLKAMCLEFSGMGGKRYLYTLFPRGPVLQACHIAGVPLPKHTLDRSFGSVH